MKAHCNTWGSPPPQGGVTRCRATKTILSSNKQPNKQKCGVHMELEIYASQGQKILNIGRSHRICLEREFRSGSHIRSGACPDHLLETAQSLRHPETKCDKKGDEFVGSHHLKQEPQTGLRSNNNLQQHYL